MKYARAAYLFVGVFLPTSYTQILDAKLPQDSPTTESTLRNQIQELQEAIRKLKTEKRQCKGGWARCSKTLDRVTRELLACQREKKDAEDSKHDMEHLLEQLQAEGFGGSEASTVSSDPTWADSNASDEPDTPSIHIAHLESSNMTLEERLRDCERAEAYLHQLEKQLEQKQKELRNCEQLSGAAKVGAGAAGLSQFKHMDKGLVFNNPKGMVLRSLNEGGFILFKQAAKETIPHVPVVEWEGHTLLDSHELTEITAEGLKAYAHDKNLEDLALVSAQVYARVKIMEQLDKHGITKPLDKFEYHTRIVLRGLLCKGMDMAIATVFNLIRN